MASFHQLKLYKDQYNNLRTNHRGEVLVFQFYYPSAPPDNSPALRAYAMKKKHAQISASAVEELSYVDSDPVNINEVRVQGDLQITTAAMEKLKSDSNPDDPEDYSYFLFSPQNGIDEHVIYEVRITESKITFPVQSQHLDPSPPATAV